MLYSTFFFLPIFVYDVYLSFLFRILVGSFMECGLAVSVAVDSMLYQTHVFAASHEDMTVRPGKRHAGHSTTTWGHRPVLLLLGICLGIDSINPIYYETIKVNISLLLSFYLDS